MERYLSNFQGPLEKIGMVSSALCIFADMCKNFFAFQTFYLINLLT